MKFESVTQAVEMLKRFQQTQAAYNHAISMLYHDASTTAPRDSWEGRGKTMEILTQVTYEQMTKAENAELLSYLEAILPLTVWLPSSQMRLPSRNRLAWWNSSPPVSCQVWPLSSDTQILPALSVISRLITYRPLLRTKMAGV